MQSAFSNLVYPSEKLSSLGQHMVFVGCTVDASFPFFCLIFLIRTLISSWSRVMTRTCSKAFEVLLGSEGRVAQSHFRLMPLEDNSGKCQTGQSKWIIRIQFLYLVDVHIKCLIIALRGWWHSSPYHTWEKREAQRSKLAQKSCISWDLTQSTFAINQAFSSKLQHMDAVNYEKRKVLLSKFWPTTDSRI